MKLNTIIYMCKKYLDDKITIGEFIKFIEDIEIKKYISLTEKYYTIRMITLMKDYNKLEDMSIVNMEMITVYDILFFYIKNFDTEGEERNIEHYDIMMESGFIDLIKKRIGPDYNKFIELLNKSFDMRAITLLNEIFQNSDTSKFVTVHEQISSLLKDEKTMSAINNILEFNNQKRKRDKNDKS